MALGDKMKGIFSKYFYKIDKNEFEEIKQKLQNQEKELERLRGLEAQDELLDQTQSWNKELVKENNHLKEALENTEYDLKLALSTQKALLKDRVESTASADFREILRYKTVSLRN